MRALAILLGIALASQARAENRWNLDLGYRSGSTIATRDSDASAYLHAAVVRLEYSYGRKFVSAVFALPLPGGTGEGESSIGGGLHHVLRSGVCIRGDNVQLFCGHSLVIDYALELGVVALMSFDKAESYYGPVVRPRVSARMLWPIANGKQLGFVATAGVATSFTSRIDTMAPPSNPTSVRVEPTFELSGVIRF